MKNDHVTERKTTLREIAEQVGVSAPTVTKVLRGRRDVSSATRAKVQELLDLHGYRAAPSINGTVELHFDSMASTNNLLIMQGVLPAAEQAGLDVVLKVTPISHGDMRWVDVVTEARHSGLILVTSRLDVEQQEEFAQAGVPLVVIDPVNTPIRPIPSIGVNNFNGGYLATSHLLELGHTRIAFVEGTASEVSNARLAGYHSALMGAGIDPVPAYRAFGNFRFEEGREAGLRLLSQTPRPTAIFATNDLEALGVLDAARSLGIEVPSELSVVGFDDAIQAISAAPRLTTVKQPLAEIGSTAVDVLLQLLAGKPLSTHRLELATELVVRESTGPAPAEA